MHSKKSHNLNISAEAFPELLDYLGFKELFDIKGFLEALQSETASRQVTSRTREIIGLIEAFDQARRTMKQESLADSIAVCLATALKNAGTEDILPHRVQAGTSSSLNQSHAVCKTQLSRKEEILLKLEQGEELTAEEQAYRERMRRLIQSKGGVADPVFVRRFNEALDSFENSIPQI